MKVRNKSGATLSIPEVGIVKAGEVIDVPKDFRNANFEPVKATKSDTETEQKVDKKKSKDK